jgi:hypothetical protein
MYTMKKLKVNGKNYQMISCVQSVAAAKKNIMMNFGTRFNKKVGVAGATEKIPAVSKF